MLLGTHPGPTKSCGSEGSWSFENLWSLCPQTQNRQVGTGRAQDYETQETRALLRPHGDDAELQEREQAWLIHPQRCVTHSGFDFSEGDLIDIGPSEL